MNDDETTMMIVDETMMMMIQDEVTIKDDDEAHSAYEAHMVEFSLVANRGSGALCKAGFAGDEVQASALR